MDRILNWMKKHKVKATLLVLILFAFPLLFVHLSYKLDIGLEWLHTKWSAGELLAYIAGFEAFVGTVALGLVSIYQNKVAQQVNERISKENNYLQRISIQKLLPLLRVESFDIHASDNDKSKSYLAANTIIARESVKPNERQYYAEIYLGGDESGTTFSKEIQLTLKNISEGAIRQIAFDRIEFSKFKWCDDVVTPPTCYGSEKNRFISVLLLPSETIEVTLKIYYDDVRCKEFWEYKNGAALGEFDICLYVTNTSISGIEYREKIYINKAIGFKGKVMYKAFEEEQENA